MTYKIFITPEAELDLEDAYNWYEQHTVGLGSEFIRVVDASFSTIQRNPFACPIVHEQVRKKLIRKFPYGLLYIIIDETISLTALPGVMRYKNPTPNPLPASDEGAKMYLIGAETAVLVVFMLNVIRNNGKGVYKI